MRVSTLFVIGCLAIAADASSKPLISVSKVTELATTSASLTLDIVKFSSSKIEESLSGEPRRVYNAFTLHVQTYLAMVKDWWSTGIVGSNVRNAWGFTVAIVSANYERINSLSSRIMDPVVSEFEKRYPSCEGLVGPSILDRLLLALWLVFFVRFTVRTLFSFVFGFPARSFRGKI